jgi:hypothetical protein
LQQLQNSSRPDNAWMYMGFAKNAVELIKKKMARCLVPILSGEVSQ